MDRKWWSILTYLDLSLLFIKLTCILYMLESGDIKTFDPYMKAD